MLCALFSAALQAASRGLQPLLRRSYFALPRPRPWPSAGQRIQVVLGLVARQWVLRNVGGCGLPLLPGFRCGWRLRECLGRFHAAFGAGHAGSRFDIVELRSAAFPPAPVAGLDIDRFHGGRDGAVERVIGDGLDAAIGADCVDQLARSHLGVTHRQFVPQ